MNHPEVTTLDDQRTARGGQGELLHGGYMVMQNLLGKGRRDRAREKERIYYIKWIAGILI